MMNLFNFQLKSDFDQGLDVHLSNDQNPHDVASLLKEYFRDLPEPLLSKELYPAFLATAGEWHFKRPYNL